jgi:hypothetical protein
MHARFDENVSVHEIARTMIRIASHLTLRPFRAGNLFLIIDTQGDALGYHIPPR